MMNIKTKQLNDPWKLFILENKNGMQVHILNYGGIITKIMVPDKNGRFENIVLGFQDYWNYKENPDYFGAIIGPIAGRIEQGCFELDGETYKLEKNEGTNHLHGGLNGFHQVVWEGETFRNSNEVGVKLTYQQNGKEQIYPGNIKAHVTYSINNLNQLGIDYSATTDKKTPVTLTNHTYFNLTGNLKDTVLNHQVKMNSDRYLKLDHRLVPTGDVLEVKDSPFDFKDGRKLKDGTFSNHEQNRLVGHGYDHYFLFDPNESVRVEVKEELSGRVFTMTTNQPGLVMYTANNLKEDLELDGGKSKAYLGVCFETQSSPAFLHHPHLPSIILNPNEIYQTQTAYSFGVIG